MPQLLITLANFVAEDAVSCEPVSLFPVYQANIREFVRISSCLAESHCKEAAFSNSSAADSLRTETGKVVVSLVMV